MKFTVEFNLDKDFVKELRVLKELYGEEFELLNGLHNSNLNHTDFISNFIDKKTVADATIDSNANARSKDITSMVVEKGKPSDKLLAFNKIFYEIKKKSGLERAIKWLHKEWDGSLYLHDASSSSYSAYCFAYDLEALATRGLFFIDAGRAQPAQHLSTWCDHTLEFVSWVSNRSSGACGLPSFLVYSFYFWQKDVKSKHYMFSPDWYRDQFFQKVIFDLNQPYLRITQSAFTNFSIFDRNYLVELFGGRQFPDGSFVIDYIEDIIEFQKAFMRVTSRVKQEKMYTFPVLTYSLLFQNGEFVDQEFSRWCSDHNIVWNDSNFFTSDNVGSLSNCCFDGSQNVLIKDSSGVYCLPFKKAHEYTHTGECKNLTIFHNGNWSKGKTIKIPKRKLYKIKTSNNKEILVTDNHINPTYAGEKQTKNLTVNDYLMFNTRPTNRIKESSNGYNYIHGFIIGMFLGDGNYYNNGGIVLSINEEKYNNTIEKIEKAKKYFSNLEIRKKDPVNKCVQVFLNSKELLLFVEKIVIGRVSHEKDINLNVLRESINFREGIIDGIYETDGGNSNRIYSSSKKLIKSLEIILTSLGKQTVINITDRTQDPCIIRGVECKRNFPLFCLRWYEDTVRRKQKDVFLCKNNSIYFKIKSIEEYNTDDEYVYCFEMKNKEEPYFTLPNGIITHNCRLLSDTKQLDPFINSIGGTALSIGSIKVNTINLRRVSLISHQNKELFFKNLDETVDICVEALDTIRHILKRNVEKGLLPIYQDGLMEFDKQYSTIGVTAVEEVMKDFGYIQVDEFGYHSYSDEGLQFTEEIFNFINKKKDSYNKDYKFNIECVPAERANVILAKKDKILFPEAAQYNIYSNQWIALTDKTTIEEKIRLGSKLDKLCGGGTIAHINLEAPLQDKEVAWKLLNKIARGGVFYFAFNVRISSCINGHGFFGEVCPICGEKVIDTWQRIVGYIVPSSGYGKERKIEFSERVWMTVE